MDVAEDSVLKKKALGMPQECYPPPPHASSLLYIRLSLCLYWFVSFPLMCPSGVCSRHPELKEPQGSQFQEYKSLTLGQLLWQLIMSPAGFLQTVHPPSPSPPTAYSLGTRRLISSLIQSIPTLINLQRFKSGEEDQHPGWIFNHSPKVYLLMSPLLCTIIVMEIL